MNIIVFSKDRACQLDLFLYGFFKQPELSAQGITVIYAYSDIRFMMGYEILRKNRKKIKWVLESDFKNDVLTSVDNGKTLTVFFTDDDIWVNDFSFEHPCFRNFYRHFDSFSCFSLRLNPFLNYCYAYGKEIKGKDRPVFKENVFCWKGLSNDYGYPMSLDGHIFKTSDILPLLKTLSYHNPNTLEAELSKNPIDKPFMSCFDDSVIVNNPCNRIQNEFLNRNEGLNPAEMNEMFLSGKRLSDLHIRGHKITAVHSPFPLVYE